MLFLSIDVHIPVLGAVCLQKSPLLTNVTGEVCFKGASQRGASGSAWGRWSLWWPGSREPLVLLIVLSLEVLLQQNTCHTLSFRDVTGSISCHADHGRGVGVVRLVMAGSFISSVVAVASAGAVPLSWGPAVGAGSAPHPSHRPAACSAGVLMAALLLTGTVVFGKSSTHFVTVF